jgi:hypothetical protein
LRVIANERLAELFAVAVGSEPRAGQERMLTVVGPAFTVRRGRG